MSADSLQAFDPCPDFDGLAEKLDLLLTLQDPASQRASRPIADEQDRTFLPPQVMLQMVADSPRVAHTGGGDNHLGGPVLVQGPGLLGGLGEGEAGEGEQVVAPLDDGDGVVVQIALQVARVNLGSLGGQGGSLHTP